MYLGERELEESIVFYAQMIDTGGSQIDATGAVQYAVYEEETGAPIWAGAMTLLGAAGTGFYSETLALLSAVGFENGKWYSIWIAAVVDGELPAAFHTFKVVERTAAPTVEQIWKRVQPANPDADAMEDIKTGVDDLEFTGEEG